MRKPEGDWFMVPVQIPLVIAGKLLYTRYGKTPSDIKKRRSFTLAPRNKKTTNKRYTIENPLHTIAKNLGSAVEQISKSISGENYQSIAKEFLPYNAIPVRPGYPAGARQYLLTDLDGDSKNELVTTYKAENELKTMVLKKKNDKWYKAAEINHTEYDELNYRAAAPIEGTGKKQLLIGLKSADKAPVMAGYSFSGDSVNKMFQQNYHRFEVIRSKGKNSNRAALAFWNKGDSDTYDIELMRWNGSELEPQKNIANYYISSVVPYYVNKINKTPSDPSGWYCLSDALAKAGYGRDALMAADTGLKSDKNSLYREKFENLKRNIKGN